MSWLFSQALVVEYLGENCLDGKQSAPLSGNPIQQAYCAPDKMTDFSRLSRFGMMFKPLTGSRGEELLMLYLEGFHARTSAPQEKAQELTENDQGCGEKWHASFVKFDPDTHLWRTHQCSLLGDLELFSQTWPQWGLMRDGECWEQRMLEQTIRGTESGLSPDGVATFHTPNTTGLDGGSNSRKALKKRQEKFPTPTASDYKDQPTSKSWKAKGVINYKLSNPEIREKWPTPDANCGSRGTQPDWKPVRKSGQPAQYTINQAVRDRLLPTPTAHNAKECASPSEYNRNTPTLATHAGGKLNPMWVEWLMGWPLGLTDLKPLGMDKCHCVQQQPSES
jgi:hypothetical protein